MNSHRQAARRHLLALIDAIGDLEGDIDTVVRWGRRLAADLPAGGRLLAVGNGGSAAQAQHLTAEIVGRYCADRAPYSAIALHTEPAALTAIANDYGAEEMFARQVAAHGRPGDICVLMSTSGRSRNVLAAAKRARAAGLLTWAMTGPRPNPLASLADETLAVDAASTATVQELHLVAVHLICEVMDAQLTWLDAESEQAIVAIP
jgi:D-sedoheptulose 7-phosphate isomerase